MMAVKVQFDGRVFVPQTPVDPLKCVGVADLSRLHRLACALRSM
jgi:hypothetical protein